MRLTKDLPVFTSDTYFPVFAQFGIVGIVLFVCFWYKRYKEYISLYFHTKNIVLAKLVATIFFFFFIESVVDSTLLQNRGAVMMMLFAIILSKNKTSLVSKIKSAVLIKHIKALYNDKKNI